MIDNSLITYWKYSDAAPVLLSCAEEEGGGDVWDADDELRMLMSMSPSDEYEEEDV